MLLRLLICTLFAGSLLYTYIDKLNSLTELKMEIPDLAYQVKKLEEEIDEISFEIERFETPAHLVQLLSEKEWSHLRYPTKDEVVVIE